jgi:hypothetical protein
MKHPKKMALAIGNRIEKIALLVFEPLDSCCSSTETGCDKNYLILWVPSNNPLLRCFIKNNAIKLGLFLQKVHAQTS